MTEDIMLGQFRAMMKFLGKPRIVVPHFNLPLPERVMGNWRREHIFFLWATDGKLSYKGWGGPKENIQVEGIVPSKLWIDRAHFAASYDCREKARNYAIHSGIEGVPELIFRFNELRWLV